MEEFIVDLGDLYAGEANIAGSEELQDEGACKTGRQYP